MSRTALAAAGGLLLAVQETPSPTPSPPPAELVGRVALKNAQGEVGPAAGSVVCCRGPALERRFRGRA